MSPLPKAARASADAVRYPAASCSFSRTNLHPAPAAARRGFQNHRKTDLLGQPDEVALVGDHPFAAGELREAGLFHRLLGADLVAHHPDHLRPGTDPAEAGVHHHLGELGVFREKAVAGVDCNPRR